MMVVGQGCRCKAQVKRLEFDLYKLTIPYSMGFFEKCYTFASFVVAQVLGKENTNSRQREPEFHISCGLRFFFPFFLSFLPLLPPCPPENGCGILLDKKN